MSRQVWRTLSGATFYVDSRLTANETRPVSSGLSVVPAGYILQLSGDGSLDTGAWYDQNNQPQVAWAPLGVPYFTGGWPPDPLTGTAFHQPPSVDRGASWGPGIL